jgi:hypothetical protein
LLISALASLTGCRGWWFWTPGDSVDNVGYHPEQPIAFSHKNHAGDRKIPCQYCHSSARRSTSAGVPPMNTCMGCHKYVGTDLEPIKLLTEKYKANEPIHWNKVHDLPDFVRFPHNRHVLSGIACQECHGEVEKMDATVHQVAPLQMGWCISCHQERGSSSDNAKLALAGDNKVDNTKKHHSVDETMTKCQTCHY